MSKLDILVHEASKLTEEQLAEIIAIAQGMAVAREIMARVEEMSVARGTAKQEQDA